MDIERYTKTTRYAAIVVNEPRLRLDLSDHEARMLRRVARLTALRPSPQIGDAELMVLRAMVTRITDAFDETQP